MYKLNRRVVIERYSIAVDEYGGSESTLSDSWEKWANVEDRMGAMVQNVNGIQWRYDTKIVMRYSASKPTRENDVIKYGGNVYMVKSIQLNDEAHKRFEVCRVEMIQNNAEHS